MARKNKRPTPLSNIPAVQTEFNPDYSTIKRDLKRIGGLAGFFVVVLAALSFFLK